MAHPSTSPLAAGRFTRRAANGCLVLLMVPAALLGYFWYETWHSGRVNDRHRQAAVASIHRQGSEAAQATARALNSSGATDPDELAAAIWQHTLASVISYDASRHTFTATAARSAAYDEKVFPLGGGPGTVDRCLTFTSVRGSGPHWTTEMTERDGGRCGSSRAVSGMVTLARNRIKNLPVADLTRPGLAHALDPDDQERPYAVKDAVRRGQSVRITILVRVGHDVRDRAEQCYRFTRGVGSDGDPSSVSAVPLATC